MLLRRIDGWDQIRAEPVVRLLGNHFRTFEYTPTTKGSCAVELPVTAVGVRKLFFDCLLLNVGVEHGDHAVAEKAVGIVRRIAAAEDAGQIVVNGCLLLPESGENRCVPERLDVLSELADALDLLTEFTERLEERGERVHLMPFGWKTHCHVEPPGYHGEAPWLIHLSACPADTGIAGASSGTIRANTRPSRPPYWRTTCTTLL
jgi:hypothetical protein